MLRIAPQLTAEDHRRDAAGMLYVYPVLSRRAGGISVGINLNPNNACNWRCIYCQVPGLTRGGPPPIDLARLDGELAGLLARIAAGEYGAGSRAADIAFSGNGEPTSAAQFADAVTLAARIRDACDPSVKLRLITNGSLLDRAGVREGVRRLAAAGGEVWFKIDGGTAAAMARINGSRQQPAAVLRRLRTCAGLATTWVQSCWFGIDGGEPDEVEVAAYVDLLRTAGDCLAGVHLYGLARASCQAEAPRLRRLPEAWLEGLAALLRAQGLTVNVSP